MKKKIAIGIVVFFMLILLIPVPLQMKDGGSIQYRAVLYSVTKYHQITMEMDVEDEEIVDSGHLVGWGIEILGIEIFNNVQYVPDTNSKREEVENQTDFLKNLPEDCNHNTQEYCNAKVLQIYEDYVVVECLDVTSGLLKEGTKTIVTTDVVSANGVPELQAGDCIRIVYNGLKRTEPEEMKIVYAIYHLDENGEVVSE